MQNETIETSIHILVPPSVAFNAWLNKELLHKWMFAEADSEVTAVEMSAQVGGGFSIVQQTAGQTTRDEITGVYLSMDPPHELQLELQAPKYFNGKTKVSVRFGPTPEGCKISISQATPQGLTTQHWHKMLDHLRMSLEVQ